MIIIVLLTPLIVQESHYKLRSFISKDSFYGLGYLGNTQFTEKPIFILYAGDNKYSGGYIDLWNDWIGAFMGHHYIYPGELENLFEFNETIFYNKYMDIRSKGYFNELKEEEILNCKEIKNHKIFIIKEFYKEKIPSNTKEIYPNLFEVNINNTC